MKEKTKDFIEELFRRRKETEYLRGEIIRAVNVICSLGKHNKLLLCGNGGSAADCEHMAGELNKGFILKRTIPSDLAEILRVKFPQDADVFEKYLQQGVPSIPLTSFVGTNTAYLNDCDPSLVFAQGVNSLGNKGDVLVCFSTSGNSKNVLYAAKLAMAKGLTVIAFTGESGGKLKEYADILLNVPSSITHFIQEYHLSIYHAVCLAVENELFGG